MWPHSLPNRRALTSTIVGAALAAIAGACTESVVDGGADSGAENDVAPADTNPISDVDGSGDTAWESDAAERDTGRPASAMRVVTVNTGTAPEQAHDRETDDGYTGATAEVADTWYGNGLAFPPMIDALAAWMAREDPDIIAFQEVFDASLCVDIPPEHHAPFICDGWEAGDASVPARVVAGVGADFQFACHASKTDACLAINTRIGRFRDCADTECHHVLTGSPIDGCGGRVRVARAMVDLVDGGSLALINIHGTSGLDADDQTCRVAQIAQIFDLTDASGAAAIADRNIILGDFNTDPARMSGADRSADAWLDAVASGEFAFVTPLGDDAPGSYAGFFDIDHVVSDAYAGSCDAAGLTGDLPAVTEMVYFDHLPIRCELHAR